ncbi:MAG: hypothetical protein KF799_10180 [Bdellovibrionales bacterium]|nr:hypothetical protein [Bdellovibrionales bacterium]
MPVDTSADQTTKSAAGEMERTPLTAPETLRVRCPHCRKLYLVQFSDIQEAKPRFECVQCRTRFWMSLPEMDLTGEVMGLPLQVKETPVKAKAPIIKKEPCPKCFKPIEMGRNECPSCGVLVEKYRSQMEFSEHGIPPHSSHLATLWKGLVGDYGNEGLHTEFLRVCQRERNLAYAAAQYSQMQKLMPQDEITSKRLREVQALAMTYLPPRALGTRAPRMYPRLWQIPLMAATLVIIVGMIAPVFRNMVGIGAALLFLAAALQFQMRRRD